MDTIQAEVIRAQVMEMPIISLDMSFSVTIIGPVYMAPRIYTLSAQQLLVKATSKNDYKRIVAEFLWDRIIENYNREVEASPIMDMFADPIKYQNLYKVELIGYPPELKEWKGLGSNQ